MNTTIGVLLMTVVALATTSCSQFGRDESAGVCGSADNNHICAVPFEEIYAHRDAFTERNVRLEGVLAVGVRPEPPGAEIPVMLLFPSMERAKICNPEFAIELVTESSEIENELRSASRGFVSVAGRLQPSTKGHWSKMEITTPPALINSEKGNFQCMAGPPPPPPEP